MVEKMLSKKEVLRLTGRPYISLWKDIKAGKFPRPIKMGDHHFARVYWLESEIEEWQQSRPRQTYLGEPGHAERLAEQVRPRRRLKKENGK